MLCRSRSYFAFLISSLALVVSLGAANEVVSNPTSPLYRTPRSHRIVREIDAHCFEILPEISHDRSTDSRITSSEGSKEPHASAAPVAVFESAGFGVEFAALEAIAVPSIPHSILRASIALSRGPPSA